MIVLGIARSVHDPSAALIADGGIVAAAEEERFVRVKHAPGVPPLRAARFCLEKAGVRPRDVDIVAYPWSLDAYRSHRWRFMLNHLRMPWSALRAVLGTDRRWARETAGLESVMSGLGIDPARTRTVFVPHHLAHAASAFHLSGMEEAAVLSVDAMGEFDSVLTARGSREGLEILGRRFLPWSLGTVYTAFTEYLGLGANDGEYKLMGMAPYGDPAKADLGPVVLGSGPGMRVDPAHVFGPSRFRDGSRYYSRLFVSKFGPPRAGDGLSEPYVHVAAAVQKLVEDGLASIVEGDLAGTLRECGGNLCLAGGVAHNVAAVGKLLDLPGVRRIFVQPAAGDAGGSLGAAAKAAFDEGGDVRPMDTAYLGPSYGEREIEAALLGAKMPFRRPGDLAGEIARIVASGEPVARFDGSMEWGPRALGNRSILAHPGMPGTANLVNGAIKFREPWRPFCPVILAESAPRILGSGHPCPFMTIGFAVNPAWRRRLSEVVHVDGTTRPQVLDRRGNPGLRAILEEFQGITGLPALMNTSFNLRGEPIVMSPSDALGTFFSSGLLHLAIGPFLVSKGQSAQR